MLLLAVCFYRTHPWLSVSVSPFFPQSHQLMATCLSPPGLLGPTVTGSYYHLKILAAPVLTKKIVKYDLLFLLEFMC